MERKDNSKSKKQSKRVRKKTKERVGFVKAKNGSNEGGNAAGQS